MCSIQCCFNAVAQGHILDIGFSRQSCDNIESKFSIRNQRRSYRQQTTQTVFVRIALDIATPMVYIGRLLQRQFAHGISHCFSVELEDMRIRLIHFDAEIAHRIGVSLGKCSRNAARAHASIKDSNSTYLRIAKVMPIGIPFHI